MIEAEYMRRAIELARRGEGFVNPNPMVGAVIVKDGRIIGEGYHERYGELHAERNAFASLTESAEGATVYVTLEPCCHYGKTPPCTEAIIENKISRVVIGSRDPNPLVAGKGLKNLREAGIEVTEDFLKDECDELNPVFFHYITTGLPYIVLKYAMTMDGKIATKTGASKWITGEESRWEIQRLRHKYMAIMAGIGTVLEDDPMLNTRADGLNSPVRIICDTGLNIHIDSNIVKTAREYKTIIACNVSDEAKEKILTDKGVCIEKLPLKDGHIDMPALLRRLGELNIDSVLVEGGGTLNDSLIREGLADRVEAFIAPKVFGGSDAKTPVEGIGIDSIDEALRFKLTEVSYHGEDVQLSYIRV
ncbi:MAG: bifunctional diaminohydroxyphosphoribosylaminopyrimidine deaminase/5-amino-6-(5-phosphoribosylamino)uracil reductase RibD [Lachnospiraceae bacterium]|nr:bifunctional diaminohydroxyphosphoribosylaminopyrimidine deaminase/5-amino-6-(5-phosphoribosylamino)uracil reductase RibD [Lachnospiraceae bacterium]